MRKQIPPIKLKFLKLPEPYCSGGIRGHAQISSGRECDTADFGAVGQTGAFELLRKKSAVKSL